MKQRKNQGALALRLLSMALCLAVCTVARGAAQGRMLQSTETSTCDARDDMFKTICAVDVLSYKECSNKVIWKWTPPATRHKKYLSCVVYGTNDGKYHQFCYKFPGGEQEHDTGGTFTSMDCKFVQGGDCLGPTTCGSASDCYLHVDGGVIKAWCLVSSPHIVDACAFYGEGKCSDCVNDNPCCPGSDDCMLTPEFDKTCYTSACSVDQCVATRDAKWSWWKKWRHSSAWTEMLAPDSPLIATQLDFNSKVLTVYLKNDGGTTLIVTELGIIWPNGNGDLEEVQVKDNKGSIWDGTAPPPEVSITFVGDENKREISAGSVKDYKLIFEMDVVTDDAYVLYVTVEDLASGAASGVFVEIDAMAITSQFFTEF